jgi:hypothetical protein
MEEIRPLLQRAGSKTKTEKTNILWREADGWKTMWKDGHSIFRLVGTKTIANPDPLS